MMASDLELYKKKYSGQRNAKQNHSEISLHTFRMATIKKTENSKHWQGYEEDVEKLEPLYTVGGIVKWYDCYGERYGVSLKS